MSVKPPSRRSAITPGLALAWSELAHVSFLNALMQAARWQPNDLAFHGGTNLHLCWQSSRYSEDLDFLLSSSRQDMLQTLSRAARQVHQHFAAIDPAFCVTVRDKTKDAQRMIVQHLAISHPQVIGQAMIKLEFWRVDPRYLQGYETALRTVQSPADYRGGIQSLIPSATLACAYADKLVAFSTRPHLKWRDLYDLWWIGTQSHAQIHPEAVLCQYLHNLQAYRTVDGLPPHQALLHLLDKHSTKSLCRAADPDLKNWLPEALWRQIHPHGIAQIVEYVQKTLRHYSALALRQAQGQIWQQGVAQADAAPEDHDQAAPMSRPCT